MGSFFRLAHEKPLVSKGGMKTLECRWHEQSLPGTCDREWIEHPALMHWNARRYLACVGKTGRCNVVYQPDLQIHCDTKSNGARWKGFKPGPHSHAGA